MHRHRNAARGGGGLRPLHSRLEERAAGEGPWILLHGMTQTSACWENVRAGLEPRAPVVTIDLPGHGDAQPPTRGGVQEAARRIGGAAGAGVYVGYSLGGRIALRLALDAPGLVRRLVLIGAHPGIEDEAERAHRRQWDESMAQRVETIGTEAFLNEWLSLPLFAHLDRASACLEQRRQNAPVSLAAAFRLLGTGAQEPVWHRLGDLTMPVLYLAGSKDAKYVAVGRRVVRAIGRAATFLQVADAGHAVPWERPADLIDTMVEWVSG